MTDKSYGSEQVKLMMNHIFAKINLFGEYTDYSYYNLSEVINSDIGTMIFDDIVFNNCVTNKFMDSDISIRNANDKLLVLIRNHYARIYGKSNIGYVSVLEKEKGCFVKTPKQLVNDILDQLPQEVWSNPHLTWFDPCCGSGTFVIEIYRRLMKNLPDPYNNKEYIFSNMIHVNDINNTFIYLLKLRLGLNKNGSYNMYSEDFLNMNTNKFDIIVGNPPFNEGKKRIYPQIIDKCIDMTKLYLAMVAPIQLIKSYTKEIMHTYNNLVKNGLIYHKEVDRNIFGKDVVVPSCYIVMNKLAKSKYDEKKLPTKTKFSFVIPKPLILASGNGRCFCGFNNNIPDFKDSNKIDINEKNYCKNYRIFFPVINGGRPTWFEKSVILNPGDYCNNSGWVFIPCESKKEAENIVKFLKSDKVKKILEENHYSRTIRPIHIDIVFSLYEDI